MRSRSLPLFLTSALILDLEDAVPAEAKEGARRTVAESIRRVRSQNSSIGLFVRPNSLETRLTGGDLEAVVLPDKHRMQVNPPAILRCKMASAIADWIRTDMAPLAAGLGSVLSGLDNFDSYDCRGRNGVAGAMLSEHGRANALDVRALKLADGQSIALTDRTVPRDLRESALHAACARFTTVLGPDSDWYHEDHIHLDLMERRNNYRICQWDVLDPLPQVAPLLPAERPADAPPREVAVKSDSQPKSDGQPKSDAAKPATASREVETTQSTQAPATKKRRQNRRF